MMRRIDLVAVFLVTGLAAAIAAPVWKTKDGVVFPPDKAKTLLAQCSRGAPSGVTGFWAPEHAQIVQLEMLLPGLLENQLSGQRHPPVQYYKRQYAGLIMQNRRVIYVNGFASYPDDPYEKKERESGKWRTRAEMVCDGGPAFFGVEYDPSTEAFAHFEFNGSP
jgi:hypothetical protein